MESLVPFKEQNTAPSLPTSGQLPGAGILQNLSKLWVSAQQSGAKSYISIDVCHSTVKLHQASMQSTH